jgi:WD repeat and SOF domain-containing protein 1
MNCNAAVWNPREPLNFAVACEDHNAYTFDMRKLDKALVIHADHVGAVMDVAFSPTGRELVTGSYDRTVRIFAATGGRSRDVYHTKRMQRVFSVAWSADAKYVLSGSDDTNLRIWKANAAERLGVLSAPERARKDYNDALKKRFQHLPDVKRILRQRHVPLPVRKGTQRRSYMRTSRKRRFDNLVKQSSDLPPFPECTAMDSQPSLQAAPTNVRDEPPALDKLVVYLQQTMAHRSRLLLQPRNRAHRLGEWWPQTSASSMARPT